MKRVWPLLFLALSLGCGDPALIKLLGHWKGSFEPETGSPTYTGYLHLYKTESKFKIELKNRIQTLTLLGTWEKTPQGVRLTTTSVDSEQPSEDSTAAVQALITPADTVRSAMKDLPPLSLSTDGLALQGKPMRFGREAGAFRFRHIETSRY